MERLTQIRTAFSVFAAVKRAWPLIVGVLATLADALDAIDGSRVLMRLVISPELRQWVAVIVTAILLAAVAWSTYKEGA